MNLPEQLFYLLFQIARHRDTQFDAEVAPIGLTLGRWRSLAVIRRIQPCSMTDLSVYASVDRTTLTRSVDQLVAEGLVTRSKPPKDRRKVLLSLTAEGEALYSKAVDVLLRFNRSLLKDVSETDRRRTTRVLKTILCNLIPDAEEANAVVRFGYDDDLDEEA